MSSLTIAVTHAIAFLTRPLVSKYRPSTIDRLHAALENQLTALFKPTWVEHDPSSGSSSRVLNLAPGRLPPSAIWRSGIAAGVQWTDWIVALGGFEFDLFVDPGCVAFRIGAWAENFSGIHIIWQEKPDVLYGLGSLKRKTLAQSIVDDEENAIFSMIDNERSEPTWMTPILDQFPVVPPKSSAFSSSSSSCVSLSSLPSLVIPSSRPSSRSSSAESTFSFSSSEGSSVSSFSTPSSGRSSLDLPPASNASISSKGSNNSRPSRSRRSRGRVPEVFIDASRKEVTNYDGGKTTVLTGGVMLGGPAPAPKPKSVAPPPSSGAWRRARW